MTLRVASEGFVTLATVRADDRCSCITDTEPDDAELQTIIDSVSDDIAVVTGLRIAGRQNVIARPCRDFDVASCCPCCGLDSIPLGDERPEVTKVIIDGVEQTADQWWLHWNKTSWMISRLPTGSETTPPHWPTWQERWKADTEDDTLAIYFGQGIHIDSFDIQEAALEAVCDRVAESSKRKDGLDGVTSITLGGATATVDQDRLDRIRTGSLGPATQRLISVVSPHGRTHSEVWAPELTFGWDLNLVIDPA